MGHSPWGYSTRYSFNIESVPAERAAVILCQKDNVLYDRNDKFIYSNQWIPLSAKCTIQEKLRLSSILDEKCSGGSIAHINLESNFPNADMAWEMLNKIAQAGVIYFAFNTRINECKNHHGFVGTDHCPVLIFPPFSQYEVVDLIISKFLPFHKYFLTAPPCPSGLCFSFLRFYIYLAMSCFMPWLLLPGLSEP